jgi:Tol biopolymer transport system component/DNA-binding winged helix-turn-helix (wHTH) protein
MTENGSNRVRFGPFRADLRTRELWKEGIRLKLAGQPFQVLEILLNNPGELVTRDELRERMWPGDTFVDFSHGLNAAVNKLRDALSDSAENPRYIETLPRRGYRFIGQVEVEAPTSAPEKETQPAVVPVPESVVEVEPEPEPEEEKPRKRKWFRPILLIGGLGVAALVVFVGFIFLLTALKHGDEDNSRPEAARLRAASLSGVPLPLTNPAFSPDGTELAVRRLGHSPATSGIFVKRVDNGELRQLTKMANDCCPAYSPDGKSIAFSRLGDSKFEVIVTSSEGGDERVIYSGQPRPERGEVGWTPDGKSLVFSENFRSGTNSILSVALDHQETKRVTNPAPGQVDRMPAYSPDGQYLAFVRSDNENFQNVYIQTVDGTAHKLTSTPTRVLGPPAWAADSQSVIFSSAEERGPQLWRVSVGGGGLPTPISEAGRNAWHPTISRRGYRLAYEQTAVVASLWKVDLTNAGSESGRGLLTRSQGKNEAPEISPDGKRLAFMSDRSGSMEIWVSGVDGSNPVQLSALGKAGTPRWSPDSKWIAFDSDAGAHGAIYVVNVDGGEPRVLVRGDSENRVPSWSHDGKWIYFASERNQGWQVWKAPLDGGPQVQITGGGGFAAWESEDGQTLYYAKTSTNDPQIWKVSVAGGQETMLSPAVVPRMWATWMPTKDGIFYVPESQEISPSIDYFDFATHQVKHVAALSGYPFWLSITSDGRFALFDQTDKDDSDIVVVENFR